MSCFILRRQCTKFLTLIFAASLSLSCAHKCAGDFITFGGGFGSKWGDPNFGEPSDVVSWAFMADGTVLDSANNTNFPAGFTNLTSDITSLRSSFDTAHGMGAFNTIVQSALNTWSQAADLTFMAVAGDTGAPVGLNSNSQSSLVDIRIGAFHFNGTPFAGSGAVGYGPPGDDTNTFFHDALAGDILINLDSAFFIAPGNEGDIFYTGGAYTNDLEGLMLHELGHAIGLGHPSSGRGEVMYVDGGLLDCCNFVNRQLSPDDIQGAQFIYGFTAVPEPSSAVLLLLTGCYFAARRRRSQ